MNPSPRDDLRVTLDRLHQELESLEGGDPEVRQMLVETLHEVEQALEKIEAASPARETESADQGPASATVQQPLAKEEEEPSVIARLRQAAQHFEESHPVLSSIIGSTIDALGRMGI